MGFTALCSTWMFDHICICQVRSTTSGLWQRTFQSQITEWEWLGTGTNGFRGIYLSFSFSFSSLTSPSPLLFSVFRAELETLSDSGINYIRIPVGYWTWQVGYWAWRFFLVLIAEVRSEIFNPIPLKAFEHLSLYIQRHLSQPVSVCCITRPPVDHK